MTYILPKKYLIIANKYIFPSLAENIYLFMEKLILDLYVASSNLSNVM